MTNLRLTINADVLDGIEREVRLWKGRETGGLLIGSWAPSVGPHAIAEIGAGPHATHFPAYFVPEVEYQQYELDRQLRKYPESGVIGNWHSHPPSVPEPSGHDLHSAHEMLETWNLPRPEAVFSIAVLVDGRFELRAFHLNREASDFSEIQIQKVSQKQTAVQADPEWAHTRPGRAFLLGVLTGMAQHGYPADIIRRNESTAARFSNADGTAETSAVFPDCFPFKPAWICGGSKRHRLPMVPATATKMLRRQLRRLSHGRA